MVNILTRKIIYRPVLVGDDKVKLYLLERREEEWTEEKKKRSKHLLDRLLAHANNIVIMNPVEEGYIFAEVEAPGLKAFVGEGGFKEAETILLPKPQPIKSIKIYKLEDDKLVKIHEYTPPSDLWGYETKIYIDPSIEYDLIIVETQEEPRPIFPNELHIPTRKTISKETKRKKRKTRKKATRKKTRKKKRKSSKRKKTKKKKKSKKKAKKK